MNAKQVWQAALGELQLKVPGPSFQTWLRTTTISEFRDGAVVIAVPSNFAREWLEKRFTRVITETLNNILGHEVEVCFEVKAPPRGESGRAITALEGVGVDTMPQELPLAAGQQESRPYMEGAHHAPLASMPGTTGLPHRGRAPGRGLQPPLPIWRGGPRQDPPAARDRPRRPAAHTRHQDPLRHFREVHQRPDQRHTRPAQRQLPGHVPLRRYPAYRRYPVHRGQREHPGGVLPHL